MSTKKLKKITEIKEKSISGLQEIENQQYYLINSINALKNDLEVLERRVDAFLKLVNNIGYSSLYKIGDKKHSGSKCLKKVKKLKNKL